jgi:hypothetical protein
MSVGKECTGGAVNEDGQNKNVDSTKRLTAEQKAAILLEPSQNDSPRKVDNPEPSPLTIQPTPPQTGFTSGEEWRISFRVYKKSKGGEFLDLVSFEYRSSEEKMANVCRELIENGLSQKEVSGISQETYKFANDVEKIPEDNKAELQARGNKLVADILDRLDIQ